MVVEIGFEWLRLHNDDGNEQSKLITQLLGQLLLFSPR